MHDKILEVVGISGTSRLGKLQAQRLAQGQLIKIQLLAVLPVQIDGEPWLQSPCTLTISHHGEEGLSALWTGLGANIARNATINASELASYDQVKQILVVFCEQGIVEVSQVRGIARKITNKDSLNRLIVVI
ncbi:diacylglycerol kinase 1-like isoform X3 [Apium graveolens]|uniref:diacylglycerol kinase 1-like isoform X3 n=1 Tax=Apium graveolens TaxID=4045 RepID=UPI003D78EC56